MGGASEAFNVSRVVEIGGLDQGIGHLVSMTTKQTHSECCVSKNVWTRGQADKDSWHGLFDIQAGPAAGVSNVSF
jgi:hypothetical protein